LPPSVFLFVALGGAVLWFYGRQPLSHTDLWGHLAYGRLICETGRIPATEPFMPLARGVPLVDTAWLSQVIGYLVISRSGTAGIQLLHASAIAACFLFVARAIYVSTRENAATLLGLALFAVLNWFQFQIVRPQIAGLACYCVLLTLLTSRRWSPLYWWCTGGLFCAWANLHGSFVVGLALLVCAALGRAIDVWRRTGRAACAADDAPFKRLILLTLVATAVSLVNPYGFRLYSEVISVSRNPNLSDLTEWQPLAFGTRHGLITVAAAIVLLAAWIFDRRRLRAGEVLAVVGFGAATVYSARMVLWWAPLAAVSFAIHAHALLRRSWPVTWRLGRSRPAIGWTIAAVALAAISLASTPPGQHLVFGRPIRPEAVVSEQTPVAATRWLSGRPPARQIFNIYEWGDYLVWAGPPEVPVFVTSQAHLVPRAVWRDYMSVIGVSPGWQEILDRYQVDLVLVDKRRRSALIDALKKDGGWKRVYEDPIAVIFTRRTNTDEASAEGSLELKE
jgi:hypothetical protein